VLSLEELEPLLTEPKCALCTRHLLVACGTKHPRQSSMNRKDNGGNYELAHIELCCCYCNLLLGDYYNGPAVFRSLFVDDGVEPTAVENEVITSYVQYLLNQHVQNEKSTNLWKRAEIRDIFELQQWRCAAFGRFFSAVMVKGNGMSASADRIDNSKGHDVRGNILFVFAAAYNARKTLTVQQSQAQLAQICAANPPVPSLGVARAFECKKCGRGDVRCAYCPSTCDNCYLSAGQVNRSRVNTCLV
jgi:hypothetical protein